MRKNQIISILLCSAMLTGAAFSCGQSETSESESASSEVLTSKIPSANNEADLNAASNEDSKAADKNEKTTESKESKNSAFDYYEDLNKEYEENGRASYGDEVYYRNGKLYFVSNENNGKEFSLISYDIEKEDMTERSLGEIYPQKRSTTFAGNKFMCTEQNGNLTIYDILDESKKDTIPNTIFSNMSLTRLLPTGNVIISWAKNESLTYYSPQSGEEKIPLPTFKDSHGLEQTVDEISYQGAYNNKVYYTNENHSSPSTFLFCLDLDTKEWTNYEIEGKEIIDGVYYGKFLIMRTNINDDYYNVIFNMETNETVGKYKPPYGSDPYYFGGNSHVCFKSGRPDIVRKKLPLNSDDAEINLDDVISDDTDSHLYPVNEKYYLYVDKAGAFLRDYEGSEPEKQVYIFNK